MSERLANTGTDAPRSARRLEWGVRLHEIPLLIGLVILWMMLWREVSAMSVVSGVLIAVVVMRVFYLPPVELAGRFNPWYALQYVGSFLWWLSVASWQVAWIAVKPGRPPTCSIIAVRLRTRSDFIITLVGITISLIPGSLVAEIDRFESTLYLHVLDTETQKDLTAMRRQVRRIEEMLIRAIGSKDEVRSLG
ncbi:Na+/H+ antiporter subunit E [Leucobacter sp. CSA2]|uniref:Na+/H+ antiporter subunit E n=1 Tax=Leucobacter edaphi TaxID=2796472 RepID=A0A934UX10_9MICO|nr:Na+/H+ antiporter subunit E [Leucobacter edaphi]MBK0421535.1 Na+/H+ antiporter subunit E [Leucobacter edaphi]